MICPFCRSEDTRVLDSRMVKDQQAIRRRRVCNDCEKRFTTYERVERVLPIVVKRNAEREPFSRQKLRTGLTVACRKRPVSPEAIEKLIVDVERHFAEAAEREVASSDIGHYVLRTLRSVDEVAYVRFASVYHEFSDVNQFLEALVALQIESRESGRA